MQNSDIDIALMQMQMLCIKMANALEKERRIRLNRPLSKREERDRRMLEITQKVSKTFEELGYGRRMDYP